MSPRLYCTLEVGTYSNSEYPGTYPVATPSKQFTRKKDARTYLKTEMLTNSSQRCRRRLFHWPRHRRLLRRWRLFRTRRGPAAADRRRQLLQRSAEQRLHRVRAGHPELQEVHGREPGFVDHLRLVPRPAEGLPAGCQPVLSGGNAVKWLF